VKLKRSGSFHGLVTVLIIKGESFLFFALVLFSRAAKSANLKQDPQRENCDVNLYLLLDTFLSFVMLRD